MSNHLSINGTDVSRFLSENDFSVETVPVFDKESEFVNIYGETVRSRIGCKITVRAVLTDADDETVSALSDAAGSEHVSVSYSVPGAKSGSFSIDKLVCSLDRVFNDVRFWTVNISLSGFVRESL